jgi:hypothetical protein
MKQPMEQWFTNNAPAERQQFTNWTEINSTLRAEVQLRICTRFAYFSIVRRHVN